MSELPHVFFQTIRDANGTEFKVESLYQAFKARLMTEIAAQNPATVSGEYFSTPPANYPLVERRG